MYEETGAVSFDIEPLCDYWVCGEQNGVQIEGNGQVYIANVNALGDIPHSEMEKICLFDSLPEELTYPEYSYEIFPRAVKKFNLTK